MKGAVGLKLQEIDDVRHRKIEFDDGDRVAGLGQRDPEIDRGRRLADATFCSGDCDNSPLTHIRHSQRHGYKSM